MNVMPILVMNGILLVITVLLALADKLLVSYGDCTVTVTEEEDTKKFTVQGGNMIGRLNIESRSVDLIRSQTSRSRPYGIKMAPDGSIWVVLFGTNKLAHVDPSTLELVEVELPHAGARPRRLEVLDDGRVWYVDYARGTLGVYDPAGKSFNEWQIPRAIARDPMEWHPIRAEISG